MSKYAKYSIWLAKTIIAVVAVVVFVKYVVTNENVYIATIAAYTAVFMCFVLCDRLKELSEWVVRVSDREHALAQSVSSLAAEQLDCKECVDKLTNKLNGGK